MTNTQEEHFGMFLKGSNFLDVNSGDLTANPAIATFKTKLDGRIADITAQDVIANTDNHGFTTAKTAAHTALLDSVVHVATGLKGYYSSPLNAQMLGKVNHPKTFFRDASETKLNTEAELIHQIADPVKTLLGPNLVTSAEVDGLNTKRLAFLAMMKVPKEKIGDGKAARHEMERLFALTNHELKDELDGMMAVYETTDTVLFGKYKSARAIDNFGGSSDSDGFNVTSYTVPPNGSVYVSTGVAGIPSGAQVYLRAIQGDVWVCLTFMPASPCTNGYQAIHRHTYKGDFTGLNIGLTGSHLQVTNPGLSNAIVRLGFAS